MRRSRRIPGLLLPLAFVFVSAGMAPVLAGVSCSNLNGAVIPSTPDSDFTLREGGAVVRHEPTGLEWQRCPLGLSWDGGDCLGALATHDWPGALAAAAAAGAGWRLPKKNELASIVEAACWSPAINAAVFPGTPVSAFWSSSPDAGSSRMAWVISFDLGRIDAEDKHSLHGVRLVRGGL